MSSLTLEYIKLIGNLLDVRVEGILRKDLQGKTVSGLEFSSVITIMLFWNVSGMLPISSGTSTQDIHIEQTYFLTNIA